jgi:hypothetical protein
MRLRFTPQAIDDLVELADTSVPKTRLPHDAFATQSMKRCETFYCFPKLAGARRLKASAR